MGIRPPKPPTPTPAPTPVFGRIYEGNQITDNVSVIDGSTNTVISTITVGDNPTSIAVNPSL
ncbi:hypothetical protein [Paenibacillus sp. LHD-38]|uniref:hypothetical protein n=1 Tax=Paenibacillus sp. LHD-38 TaxID=3072143 RepID=UPI00280F11A7|nr:hypothetical protein [Paenibacillus sp. LHD-38]MDQ8739017.1 hypothetical protein [Paenibacillus sp. LHD-38]